MDADMEWEDAGGEGLPTGGPPLATALSPYAEVSGRKGEQSSHISPSEVAQSSQPRGECRAAIL
jgi:hypothetical protein